MVDRSNASPQFLVASEALLLGEFAKNSEN